MQFRFPPVLIAAILMLMVAACSSAPPAPVAKPRIPTAAPTPTPTVPQQRLTGEWIDWPITRGDWVYRQDDRGSIALFGTMGQDALVTLRCDRARGRLYLARAAEGITSAGQITIRSSSTRRELAVLPTGGNNAYRAAEILPNDPVLDAIVYTRGRIAIETSGQQPIAIPVWSEIPRVVEDCRG